MANTSGIDLKSVKRRKILIAGGILAGVIGFSVMAVWLTSGNKNMFALAPKDKIKNTTIASPGEQIKPSDVWRAMSEGRITNVESEVKDSQKQNKQNEAEIKRLQEQIAKMGQQSQRPAVPGRAPGADLPPLPPGSPLTHNASPVANITGPSHYGDSAAANRAPGAPGVPGRRPTDTSALPASNGIETVSFIDGRAPVATGASGTLAAFGQQSGRPRQTVEHYIPSGSFTPVLVLGGIDAPAGGQASQNPQPVLFMLKDQSILPNDYRYDAKQCHLLGAGYGDINSERAYIRLERLSCVLKDGTVVDRPVKGYVADETGKAGMKGRVVTKTGQVLAMALVSGVASGIGKAFAGTANTVSVSPLGTTSTVDPSKVAQSGVGNGLESAGDKLANYYIKLADQLFPIIEVDAGRSVDAVFTEGVDLGKYESQQAPSGEKSSSGGTSFSPRPQQASLNGAIH